MCSLQVVCSSPPCFLTSRKQTEVATFLLDVAVLEAEKRDRAKHELALKASAQKTVTHFCSKFHEHF